MRFHADLHVHSKYSRATSRDLDLEHMATWASRKGIQVIGTGDFTHPVWRAELKQKLVPSASEPGLFRLRSDVARAVSQEIPPACVTETRFMLEVEISTIYKKGEKTRKIHHLIYAPDFDTADRISARLARIGNISSDGRPILGLDSRHLLEIVLESHPDAYLIPAHIWTPWFAALGSRSGFDSITECYGDLSDHIFAVETGLSSDPPMNWRLSMLDKYRLVSNSDAHSPGKLGRETTVFDCPPDYFSIRRALATGDGYVGTVEFFPEEGKYHLDGHRRCNVRQTPQETLEHSGRCPVCGQPTTVGVLHRIETLADRGETDVRPPETAGTVSNLVPLPEIVAEVVGTGTASKRVKQTYDRIITSLGPELAILQEVPIDTIAKAESELLGEAIRRLRAGHVIRDAGYDGEYGVIKLFEPSELKTRTVGGSLFDFPDVPASMQRASTDNANPKATKKPPRPKAKPQYVADSATDKDIKSEDRSILSRLDEQQLIAAQTIRGALLIVAGPGSGKTRTITHRIAHLITECNYPASSCLAITFTRRAAAELRERLEGLLGEVAKEVEIHTFHSFGLSILRAHPAIAGLSQDFHVASEAERISGFIARTNLSERKAKTFLRDISKVKRTNRPAHDDAAQLLSVYEDLLRDHSWIDFDDLIRLAVRALESDATVVSQYRERFRSISADEFQDVDEQQYRLLQLIAPPGSNVCVIGDPNQAIYGFRGADASCFARFTNDYPDATTVRLSRNYRSSGTIVRASSQLVPSDTRHGNISEIAREMLDRITTHAAPTDRAEAEYVVHTIEQLIGGHTFFSIDSGRTTPGEPMDLSFADFAVLYRTSAQAAVLREALERSGIPFKQHSHELLIQRPGAQELFQEFMTLDAPDSQVKVLSQLRTAADQLAGKKTGLDPIHLEEALHCLSPLAESCGQSRDRFIDTVALATDVDIWDPRADRVSLLTMHAAKGLEFPVVFMVGLEDGILPLYWGDTPPDMAALEEERRLCYVGMTRAKDRLIVSRAMQRPWRGRVQQLEESPFLRMISDEFIQRDERQKRRAQKEDVETGQLELL